MRPRSCQPARLITGSNGGGAALRTPASKPVPFTLVTHLFFSFSKVVRQKALQVSYNSARKLPEPMERCREGLCICVDRNVGTHCPHFFLMVGPPGLPAMTDQSGHWSVILEYGLCVCVPVPEIEQSAKPKALSLINCSLVGDPYVREETRGRVLNVETWGW